MATPLLSSAPGGPIVPYRGGLVPRGIPRFYVPPAGAASAAAGSRALGLLGGPVGIVATGVSLGIPAIQEWEKFRDSPTGSLFADRFRQQTDRLRTGDIQGFAKNLFPGQPGPVLQDVSSNLPVNATAAGLRQASDAYARSAKLPARSGGGGGGQVTAPATSPNTITQAADDDYKQLLSQYGGQTGLNQLAALTSLPTGFTPEGGKQAASLKDYYAAQQAVGGKNINDIITSMGYSGPMAEWAKANPMLAQREFAKRQAATPAPTLEGDLTGYGINANLGAGLPTSVGNLSAPSPYVPMSGFNLNSQIGSTGNQGYNAPPVTTGVFSPFKYGSENFGNPANPVVAPPAETQRVLNAPFNEAMVQAGRGLNPDNYTSQNFSVSKKADDFLSQPWLQGLGR